MRVTIEIGQDPTPFAALTLHMAYNDGFVTYLNGTRFAADRAPESPA